MAKAKNPITFGEEFSISTMRLSQLGVLDVTLAIDTRLFVDPMLLESSRHPEISGAGVTQYRLHFEKIIQLLKGSKIQRDPAWKAALRLLTFPEVRGTCLGYGAASIHGSGFGPKLSARLIGIANDIVDIGIENPDLFAAMALFESDIGPDRISDMTTNVIFDALADFNQRILGQLNLKGSRFLIHGKYRTFVNNPYEARDTPVVLVPTDLLRHLPVAHDWDSVCYAAQQNDELRERVNKNIGEIWAKKTKRDKERLKSQALSSRDAFQALLDVLRCAKNDAYNTSEDPEGLIIWATLGQKFARDYPVAITKPKANSLDDLQSVVAEIVTQFRHLIEHCGLNKELYRANKKLRHESTAQRLFFAAAYSYCRSNGVDVSPEIDTGNGKIDFKFSTGFQARVLVEIKLSTNPSVVSGYINQLEEYKQSQQTMRAFYVVIDVGKMGSKENKLIAERNDARKRNKPLSELEFVDGTIKAPPSKRRK